MKIITTYKVQTKGFNKIFDNTTRKFREAEEFYLEVILKEWPSFCMCKTATDKVNLAEALTVVTKARPTVPYDFGERFYKFPCYYRRAVISKAIGKVSSYKSNLANWELEDPKVRGKRPSLPQVGNDWAVLYKDECYVLDEEQNLCEI